MAAYDFSTLNFSDLEELVCDLLNAQEQERGTKICYKSFKDGKDKGIDLLYTTNPNEYQHVVQVKHYLSSGYKAFFKDLKEEKQKVNKLSPLTYLVATSIDLSVQQCQDIMNLFSPYIKSSNDILGKKDLNRMLEKYPDILSNHFKLWFSATAILKKILHSDLSVRAAFFTEHELKRKLRLYVKTNIFDIAKKNLQKNKLLIITGEPGVGKTTLAEILIYEYIKNDFSLTCIYDDIKEVERVLINDTSKQIIYYDDFLGSNEIEINKARGSETTLGRIVRRIENLSNKYFICTTRSHLFNSVVDTSETLQQINVRKKESILRLTEYSEDMKRQLLQNHIEESLLQHELKSVLEEEDIQTFIVNHDNFFPRSVEFITKADNIDNLDTSKYRQFIRDNFDIPKKIWHHAYTQQIKEDDRILLNTLLTFEKPPTKEELEVAFHNRIDLEIKYNNKVKEINCFRKSIIRLNGAFISFKEEWNEIQFINPSIVDFLNEFLKDDPYETRRILESISYTSQLVHMFLSKGFTTEMPQSLTDSLTKNYNSFVRGNYPDLDRIRLILILFKTVELRISGAAISNLISETENWDPLEDDYSLNLLLKELLLSVDETHAVYTALKNNIEVILSSIVKGSDDVNEVVQFLNEVVKLYNINFFEIDNDELQEHIRSLVSEYIDQQYDQLKDWIEDESDVFEAREELESIIDDLSKLGFNCKQLLNDFDTIDWWEIAMENRLDRVSRD